MDTERAGLQTARENIYHGALYGLMAWTAYAVVECCFTSVLPWFIEPSYQYMALHWGFTVFLFALYPILGFIVGGLSGIGFRELRKRIQYIRNIQPAVFLYGAATFIIVFIFLLNLLLNYTFDVYKYIGLSLIPTIFFSLVIIIGLVLSTKSDAWFTRLRFLTNPWTTSILLLGLPWINDHLLAGSRSVAIKAGAEGVYAVSVLSASFLIHEIKHKRSSMLWLSPTNRYLYFPILLIFIFLGTSYFLKQTPLHDISYLGSSPSDQDNPNVILIVMDTVRADHLSLYGYERDTTPFLKKLSEEATLYAHAISSTDLTLSSHASIFTGMYARQHGSHYDPWDGHPKGRPLDNKFHTVAEILSEEGYRTMAVVANYGFLGPGFGLDQGFQYYDARYPVPFFGDTEPYYIRQGICNIANALASTPKFDMVYRNAGEIDKAVISQLGGIIKEKKPFFLFINYMDAHNPYTPPPPFDELFPGKSENFTLANYHFLWEDVMRLKRKIREEEFRHIISQYDGEIAYVDRNIENIIEYLRKLGLYDNSLIIITSDHGEAFGEKNLIQHGVSVYQNQVNIPLLVKYPNISEGRVINEYVSLVDVFPTILDVSGYEMPAAVSGQSLLTVNTGKTRDVISESFPSGDLLNTHSRFDRVEQAIFSGNLKFVSSTAGKRELYDLSNDPDEKDNLYRLDDAVSRELEARLNQWLEQTGEASASPSELDNDAIERLRTLGYIK